MTDHQREGRNLLRPNREGRAPSRPQGAVMLDGEWKVVEGATAAEKAAMRFFKVVVEVQ